MSKKIGLAPKTGNQKKKEEREKQLAERSEYIGSMADKVMTAIEEVFLNEEKKPVGFDMLDVVSLASVFVFARQIRMSCKDTKTMKSVMRSTMWALNNHIEAFAEPLINEDKPWVDMLPKEEEGGEDDKV